MKYLAIVFVLFTLVSSSLVAKEAKLCSPFTPFDARLDWYPFAKGPMSYSQMADLKLSAYRLEAPLTVYNYYSKELACDGKGTWKPEVLPPGELVFRGPDGYIAYRAACWNRLVAIVAPVPPSRWDRFWEGAGKSWGGMVEGTKRIFTPIGRTLGGWWDTTIDFWSKNFWTWTPFHDDWK